MTKSRHGPQHPGVSCSWDLRFLMSICVWFCGFELPVLFCFYKIALGTELWLRSVPSLCFLCGREQHLCEVQEPRCAKRPRCAERPHSPQCMTANTWTTRPPPVTAAIATAGQECSGLAKLFIGRSRTWSRCDSIANVCADAHGVLYLTPNK